MLPRKAVRVIFYFGGSDRLVYRSDFFAGFVLSKLPDSFFFSILFAFSFVTALKDRLFVSSFAWSD